jgi:electron transport complex protein RnfG
VTPVLRSGLTLAAIAAICSAFVVASWYLTVERIAANEKAFLEQSLAPALGNTRYDSSLLDSMIEIAQPHDLPGSGSAYVYRVFLQGEPAAALFVVSARDGYTGPIRLLIGIGADSRITGVRVLEHRETPGLGDGIEISKSDWALQFDGRSLGDPGIAGWAIAGDGGEFDQLTGASVTPRAVIKAIRQTLIYFEANRDHVFSAPPSEGMRQ